MINRNLSNEFAVYFDPSKSTSGQRFFEALYRTLGSETVSPDQHPAAILFNISAPIEAIIKAKIRRQKVALRVDGLYCDRLSPAFLATFKWPLRHVFWFGSRYPWAHDFLAHFANLINSNYAAFVRIMLADMIIYQSKFSRDIHDRYFHKKAYEIIVNGSTYQGENKPSYTVTHNGEIRLVTIYDEWRTSKRVHDLITFLQWTNEIRKVPIRLTILGYTGNIPPGAPQQLKSTIETAPYIETLPKFRAFTPEIRDGLLGSDIYITFTYRDPCPNAVVEAMAHGLPVVGIASGGLPDIVGDAGILLPGDDFSDGFFSSFRYGSEFPRIDFEKMLDAVLTVSSNYPVFQSRVRKRFATDLDISVVATRYASVMRSLIAPAWDHRGGQDPSRE